MWAFVMLFVFGRVASLVVYQVTWRSGEDAHFPCGSTTLALLRKGGCWLAILCLGVPAGCISWEEMPLLRGMACVLSLLLAVGAVGRWGAADVRRYFLADRALAVAMAVGVFHSPGFVFPCLMICCALQYSVSSFRLGPGYSNLLGFEFVRSSLCLLVLGMSCGGMWKLWGDGGGVAGWDGVVFSALLALQASNYLNHGLAKAALGPRWYSWILENRVECLVANAWLRGWVFGRSRERMMEQVRWVARRRVVICAAVWLLEISWLFVLADVRFAMLLLGVTMMFHVGVFAITGLASYHYLINHAYLLYFLSIHGSYVYELPAELYCLMVLPLSFLWVGALRKMVFERLQTDGNEGGMGRLLDAADHLMAWWDTPLMRTYSYCVTTATGKRYDLPTPKFSPHDTALTDLATHLMILGRHPEFDADVKRNALIARTGVWGLTVFRRDRDFLYGLMDGNEAEIRRALTNDAPCPPWRDAPECVRSLRDWLGGINAQQGKVFLPYVMRWPHFPGEDLVSDLCPLMNERDEIFRFDEEMASLTVRRTDTFLQRNSVMIWEAKIVGIIDIVAKGT